MIMLGEANLKWPHKSTTTTYAMLDFKSDIENF